MWRNLNRISNWLFKTFMMRNLVPVCGLVSRPVGDPVGDPVGGPVCGLVDGPSGPCGLWSKHVLLHTPYNRRPASNAWILVGKRSCVLMFSNSGGQLGVQSNYTKEPVCDRACRGLRVSHGPVLRCCCGAAAVLLQCCSVAVLLWWCCGSLAVVQAV